MVALFRQKIAIMQEFLEITQQELLLVDLDGLGTLLERKDHLIREIVLIDEALGFHTSEPPETEILQEELTGLVGAILENERTLERRMEKEYSQLRQELREFDQETQLKLYLERAQQKGGKVNLKK